MTDPRSAASPHVVAGQTWRSLDPRDKESLCVVVETSGPGGYVQVQRKRKTRIKFERFLTAYELVQP